MNIKELYDKMKNKVKGEVLLEDDNIYWKLPNEITFTIGICECEGYIEVNYKNYCITHWHPLNEEIYDDIMYMNNDVYWIKKKKLFGYSSPMFIGKNKYDSFSEKKKSKYIFI